MYTKEELQQMVTYDGPWSWQMARELATQLLSALEREERHEGGQPNG